MGMPKSPPWFITMLTAQLAMYKPDMTYPAARVPDTRPTDLMENYDFIVIGAGTGGKSFVKATCGRSFLWIGPGYVEHVYHRPDLRRVRWKRYWISK